MRDGVNGSRSDWETLLPLLQAFVAGQPVQRLDYCGRWIDTDEMICLMQGRKHRLKPKKSVEGVWTRNFEMRVDGLVGPGTMHWPGDDTDTPEWPERAGLVYTGPAVFTPSDNDGDEQDLMRQGAIGCFAGAACGAPLVGDDSKLASSDDKPAEHVGKQSAGVGG